MDRDSLRLHLNTLAADMEMNGLGYYSEHINYIVREFFKDDCEWKEPNEGVASKAADTFQKGR